MYILDKKSIFLVVCLCCFFSYCQETCSGNNYLTSNNGCASCGGNSISNGTDCICDKSFIRFLHQRYDYSTQCYRLSSAPKNLELTNITNTSLSYQWQPPEIVDQTLESRFLIILLKCDSSGVCLSRFAKEVNSTQTKWSTGGLVPNTWYRFVVCASNDVFINNTLYKDPENHESCALGPKDLETYGSPGYLDPAYISAVMVPNSKKHIFRFRKPKSFGGVTDWSVHITCDDSEKTSITESYNTTSFADNHNFFLETDQICALKVRCQFFASNIYGTGQKTAKIFQFNDDCNPPGNGILIGLIVGVLVVVVVILVILVFLWRWKKRQEKMEQLWLLQLERANNVSNSMIMPFRARNLYVDAMEVEQTLEKEFSKHVSLDEEPEYCTDEHFKFEYERQNLEFKYKLGEGQFGCVYKAEAIDIAGRPGKATVAVKVLKENPEEKDKNEFMDELELMKEIKPHPNIVRLLGCCTRKGQLAMIVEVMPSGDLCNFLRKSKKRAGEKGMPIVDMIDEKEFLQFAVDIASGMAHLSAHNIVHRDLACRNVLVGINRICKISDMGLARFLNDDGVYHREKEAKLPVKWMSPESIKYGRASIQSDIWSFGIVLWEIFTLGASPYPGYTSKEVPHLLCYKRYRMDKPEHCSDSLFNIITDCWEEAYDLRPSFEELKIRIKKLKNGDEKYMSFEYYNDDAYLSSQDDEVLFNEVQEESGKLNLAYQSEISMDKSSVRYQP